MKSIPTQSQITEVGTCKKYKPKQENIKKLELFLKSIENGRQKDK